MKSKEYKILLDIYKGVQNPQKVEFVTEDNGTAKLKFKLFEDKITPYSLENCVVRMVIQDQQQNCIITDETNGECEITLLGGMFKDANNYIAELQVYDSSNQTLRLTTPQFRYNVRASLMNGENVQADPNFSILQDMILEVSNANEVANNAKVTAEGALATANQAQTKATEIMANGDYAKQQGDYAKAEGDKVANKYTLNGLPQTNFNFIENGIEKNGLVVATQNSTIELNGAFSILIKSSNKFDNGTVLAEVKNTFVSWIDSNLNVRAEVTISGIKYSIPIEKGIPQNGTVYILFYNNKLILSNCQKTEYVEVPAILTSQSGVYSKQLGVDVIFYNRVLTLKEIQHNFNVLNNSPSINTIDAGNKKLLLSSDTDHVQDRTGRTQEQINRKFYKRSCREFTADSTGKITVNNGEEGYVLSGEIKGQTVKNEILSYTPRKMDKINNYMTTSVTANMLQVNKQYTIIYFIEDFVGSGNLSLSASNTIAGTTVTLVNGILKKLYTPTESVIPKKIVISNRSEDFSVLVYGVMILEGDWTNKEIGYFTALSSTQAIISNNGIKYNFYMPTIEGTATGLVPTVVFSPALPTLVTGDVLDLATKTITFVNKTTRVLTDDELKAYLTYRKVILLGGLPNAKNTLEILENGSGIYVENTIQSLINESSTPILRATGENTQLFEIIVKNQADVNWNTFGYINDRLPQITATNMAASDIECFSMAKTTQFGDGFLIRVLKSNLQTQDIAGFKAWLKANPITVRYQLATPIVTTIDKSIMPTIQTSDKINICGVESPVAPSSLKLTLPVDRIGELETRLARIESLHL